LCESGVAFHFPPQSKALSRNAGAETGAPGLDRFGSGWLALARITIGRRGISETTQRAVSTRIGDPKRIKRLFKRLAVVNDSATGDWVEKLA